MLDIETLFEADTGDLKYIDSQIPKAQNLLNVVRYGRYYNRDFGINISQYVESSISFQNEVIRAHIVERLTFNGLGVSDYISVLDGFLDTHGIKLSLL
jgi:hypothetical protein